MELKDLKSAWDTSSSQEVDKHHLERESIHELMRHKTQTLVDRIDRNIRIGLGVLLVFIAYVVVDSLFLSEYFSKLLVEGAVEYPRWLEPLDVFTTALIVTTYLFFVLRYLKIRRSFSIDLQLKNLVYGILETLQTYRRMFYMAVVILLLNMVVGFAAGLYEGIKFNAGNIPGGIESLATSKILMIIGVGLAVLIPMIAITYLLLRWGFNKLYGRYLVYLNDTLKELDESGE
jgi:hypothetical protein